MSWISAVFQECCKGLDTRGLLVHCEDAPVLQHGGICLFNCCGTPTQHSHLTPAERGTLQCHGTAWGTGASTKAGYIPVYTQLSKELISLCIIQFQELWVQRVLGVVQQGSVIRQPAALFTLHLHRTHNYILEALVKLQTSCLSLLQTLFLH